MSVLQSGEPEGNTRVHVGCAVRLVVGAVAGDVVAQWQGGPGCVSVLCVCVSVSHGVRAAVVHVSWRQLLLLLLVVVAAAGVARAPPEQPRALLLLLVCAW